MYVSFSPKTKSIGSSGFENSGVVDVYVPSSVESIYSAAFLGCHALRNVRFEGSTELSSQLFNYSSISNVTLPETCPAITQSLFHLCRNLKHIRIPPQVTHIASLAFAKSSLQAVTIPASVRRIDSDAFTETPLKTVMILSCSIVIGQRAFFDCPDLTEVTYVAQTVVETNSFKENKFVPKFPKSKTIDVFDQSGEISRQAQPGVMHLGPLSFGRCLSLSKFDRYTPEFEPEPKKSTPAPKKSTPAPKKSTPAPKIAQQESSARVMINNQQAKVWDKLLMDERGEFTDVARRVKLERQRQKLRLQLEHTHALESIENDEKAGRSSIEHLGLDIYRTICCVTETVHRNCLADLAGDMFDELRRREITAHSEVKLKRDAKLRAERKNRWSWNPYAPAVFEVSDNSSYVPTPDSESSFATPPPSYIETTRAPICTETSYAPLYVANPGIAHLGVTHPYRWPKNFSYWPLNRLATRAGVYETSELKLSPNLGNYNLCGNHHGESNCDCC